MPLIDHQNDVFVFQIEQNFVLLFGEETSPKSLKRWPTTFKKKPNPFQAEQHLVKFQKVCVGIPIHGQCCC